MRLMQLTFAALGPFPGTHTIDFTRFEASGLYLLRGTTGSGKSSIIDAITFGLYGTVAGGRKTSSMERLRSNYAHRDTATEVSLRFEVSSGFYEVTRRPSYLKEGNKNPTPSTAVLHKLSMADNEVIDRQPIATRVSEVDREIPRIIGVGEDQFLQTVVLPQGKFARFIQSGPNERKGVLEDIFRTQPFEEFTRRLREQAEEAEQQFKDQLAATVHCGMSLSEAIGDYCSTERFDDAQQEAADLLTEHTIQGHELSRLEFEARANSVEIQSLLDESRAIDTDRRRWLELKHLSDELMQVESQRESQRSQINRAREARTVTLAIEALSDAHRDLSECQVRFESTLSQLEGSRIPADALPCSADGADTADLLARCGSVDDELSKHIATLEVAVKREKTLSKHREDRDSLSDIITSLTESRTPLAETVASAPEALNNLQELIDTNRTSIRALPEAIAELNDLTARLNLHDAADAERKKLTQIAEDIGEAAAVAMRSKAVYDDLYARWLTNSALVLGEHLTDGTPCPVCGSVDHPDPITGDSFEVSFDDVNRAHETSQTDTERVQALQRLQRETTALITDLDARAGGMRILLEEQRDTKSSQVESLRALDEQTNTLEKELDEARQQLEQSRESLRTIDLDLATHSARLETLDKTIDSEQDELKQVRGSFESVEDLLENVGEQRARIREFTEATRALATALSGVDKASRRVDDALEKSPFNSTDEATLASLSPDALAELEAIVTDYDEQVTSMRARLSEVERSGLYLRRPARIDQLQTTAKALSERYDQAHDQVVSHAESLRHMSETVQLLATRIRALKTIDDDAGPIRRLALAARGAAVEDGNRIPLGTWVLMTRFEDVLAAANPYLTQFSSGRYALRRTATDPGSRASIGGLGLAVFDFETDYERAPTSLSGGETFYVSLALALGLVEIVSSEAGGIEFRSMIIDEGFGHLDQGTLDQVMQGLEKLRDTGRTVGIVSHVEEMHRRINDGIHVRKQASGSTLTVVG